ncbi:MAG: hypothetical protein RMH84_06330 [Sulfolobales archaeon]|nr:hypothetical protein [Sulfolobales archaeon]MCX8209016.1 hypothetical protein [Sulfolobales archaeon]MDW8011188.1 hypothetical protein [Sulfolobales archaeon]
MSPQTPRGVGPAGKLLELSTASALTALSLVLHIFKFPYPPAPFLKFDGVGIPLAVLALYSWRTSLAVLPVIFIGLHLMGADFVGASMKIAAEASTFIPLSLLYSYLCLRRAHVKYYAVPVVIGAISRILVMSLLNYIITPHWLVLTYGWTYDRAYSVTIALLPHIAVFNAIAASYVGALSIGVFRVVSKTLGIGGTRTP